MARSTRAAAEARTPLKLERVVQTAVVLCWREWDWLVEHAQARRVRRSLWMSGFSIAMAAHAFSAIESWLAQSVPMCR